MSLNQTPAFHSHKSSEWYTPSAVYRVLNREFWFTFDPFPASFGKPPAFDGLTVPWSSRNFVNPPYSLVGKALAKGYSESLKGNLSVFLIFVRSDTKAWRDYILDRPNVEVRFITGRLKFVSPTGVKGSAPAPSAVVVMYPIGAQATRRVFSWSLNTPP